MDPSYSSEHLTITRCVPLALSIERNILSVPVHGSSIAQSRGVQGVAQTRPVSNGGEEHETEVCGILFAPYGEQCVI